MFRFMKNSQASGDQPILSVNELNQYAKGVLDMHVGKVWVTGEISNFSRPASGHWYFTLKDSAAQIRCAMFRNRNGLLRINPENGLQVLLQGNVSLYPQRGDFQLIVDYMEESGLGALQRQFELLKNMLLKEGLFEQSKKQSLPLFPKHIGLITSKTGAALQDMLRVMRARNTQIDITLIPCSVQGDQAAKSICRAIALANQWNEQGHQPFDALIVGRGGGSIEDLWPFNEERVARTIYACPTPIISAVGHETDTTISDLVADVRAPTPSVAAEMITPEQTQLYQHLDQLEKKLIDKMQLKLHADQHRLTKTQHRLEHPGKKLVSLKLRFDQMLLKLQHSQGHLLNQKKQQLDKARTAIHQFHPEKQLTQAKEQLSLTTDALNHGTERLLKSKKTELQQMTRLLDGVSPLATLHRGYAIIEKADKRILRHEKEVETGDIVTAKLKEGTIKAKIL